MDEKYTGRELPEDIVSRREPTMAERLPSGEGPRPQGQAFLRILLGAPGREWCSRPALRARAYKKP